MGRAQPGADDDQAEWLAGNDPTPMLAVPAVAADWRKLRLFGTACCRRLGRLLHDPRVVRALDAADRYTDGAITAGTYQGLNRVVVHYSGNSP